MKWGDRSNFKRACKFSNEDGQFLYRKECIVILERNRQLEIVRDIHEGIGQSEHSKVLSSHYGQDSKNAKIIDQFFWYSIYKDVVDFCRACDICQKQSDLKLKSKMNFITYPGFKLSVSQSQNMIYSSIIVMPKKSNFTIFTIQNFKQSMKKTHVNSIYIVGIMFLR